MISNNNIRCNELDKEEKNIPLLDIFWTFFRIGLLTLGGGLAMSPVMRHELVIKRHWVKDSDFCSIVALATVIPGAIAVNIAYLLGQRLGGKRGLILAILGVILPSFIIILFIVTILFPFFYHPTVVNFLRGCAIAVLGQLGFASFVFSRRLLRRWPHFIVCATGILVIGVFGMHPIFGLIAASLLGYWLCPGKK